MAGTYQEGTSKPLSGVYTLIVAAINRAEQGGRGTIAYPFTADWGPVNTLDTVMLASEFKTKYNAVSTNYTAKLIHDLAFKAKPQRLLTYRMATPNAKKAEVSLKNEEAGVALVLETLYPSDRPFVAVVKDGLISGKVIEILEGTVLLVKVEGDTLADLVAKLNVTRYVRVKTVGEGLPAVTAGDNFAGGNNGNDVTVTEYDTFLTKLNADGTANAFSFDGVEDEALLTVAETWLKQVRDEGFYVAFARGGSDAWSSDLSLANAKSKECNYRAIHNVGNGLNGYSPAEMAVFIAGRIGSVPLNRTLADEVVDFDTINVLEAVTPGERVKAKEAGTIVFMKKGDAIMIDEGVNTMTTPMAGEVKEFGKIRVSNALDHIAKDLEAFGDEYKKDKSNTPEARETYAATIETTYFRSLIAMEVLKEGAWYRPDPEYHGENAVYIPKIDEAFFYSDITPVDSMERIYQKFGVSF